MRSLLQLPNVELDLLLGKDHLFPILFCGLIPLYLFIFFRELAAFAIKAL